VLRKTLSPRLPKAGQSPLYVFLGILAALAFSSQSELKLHWDRQFRRLADCMILRLVSSKNVASFFDLRLLLSMTIVATTWMS
jgi:hypothetical protein